MLKIMGGFKLSKKEQIGSDIVDWGNSQNASHNYICIKSISLIASDIVQPMTI